MCIQNKVIFIFCYFLFQFQLRSLFKTKLAVYKIICGLMGMLYIPHRLTFPTTKKKLYHNFSFVVYPQVILGGYNPLSNLSTYTFQVCKAHNSNFTEEGVFSHVWIFWEIFGNQVFYFLQSTHLHVVDFCTWLSILFHVFS